MRKDSLGHYNTCYLCSKRVYAAAPMYRIEPEVKFGDEEDDQCYICHECKLSRRKWDDGHIWSGWITCDKCGKKLFMTDGNTDNWPSGWNTIYCPDCVETLSPIETVGDYEICALCGEVMPAAAAHFGEMQPHCERCFDTLK